MFKNFWHPFFIQEHTMTDYSNKIISADKAVSLVKSGDVIVAGFGVSEPRAFFNALPAVFSRGIKDISLNTCFSFFDGELFVNGEYAKFFEHDSWFFTGPVRKNVNVSYFPNHLHQGAAKRFSAIKPDIYVANASVPDKHGFVSLGTSNVYAIAAAEIAGLVILEINPNVPRVFGDVEFPLSKVDYLVEAEYALPEIPDAEPSFIDKKIGKLVSDEISDGDCIQLGVGGMPNAIAKSLYSKKDLGVHTEMLTNEMVKLAKAGVITGEKKQIHKRKMVCTLLAGTRGMYDFVDDNPSVSVLAASYVNDPCVIAQNDNQVSVNAALEVDVTGQCASESIGAQHFSGTGGQADTAIGAQKSRGGRSYICLHSTAQVKDKEGSVKAVSKIVPVLRQGAAVSLSRNDVDRVVTEYGIAELRGRSIRERVRRLVDIACPDSREEILRESFELGIIPRQFF
jgi:acyl-CoA hydrolase